MYYPCSENKDTDQLRGYREADLRLCFRPCKLLVFSRTGSNGTNNNLLSRYVLQKAKNDRRSHRVPKTRLRKENRQKLKERRSGLFVKEERLAVSTVASGDGAEEEVDVLG